jgi:hypothetical protein
MGANPRTAATAEEKKAFPLPGNSSIAPVGGVAAATAAPARRGEQRAPPSPGEGGEEMGEDGGWPVPLLRLRFDAASVKAAALGEDILAELHNDMTLYCLLNHQK